MNNELENHELKKQLFAIYSDFFETDYLEKYLEIPTSYLENISKIYHRDLFSVKDAIIHTSCWVTIFNDDFLERKENNTLTTGDKIFLVIGEWGSKHDFLLCCDSSSPDYGKVFDANDAHPWMREDDWEGDWENFNVFVKEEFKIDL